MICLFALCFSVASAEIRVPFNAPPQAVALAVKARSDEPVEIFLRCSGGLYELPKFRIRTQPQFGKLSEPRLVTKDSALVVYLPKPKTTGDKFTYSIQTSQGVSVPVEVIIRVIEEIPILVVSEEVDLGKVLLGESAKESFEIENRGGGVVEGTFNMQGDFKIDGPTSYRLVKGEKRKVSVNFTPLAVGKTANAIVYSSHPDRQITLLGEGLGPIQSFPADLTLLLDAKDGIRRGRLEILNRTALSQDIQIRADSRLKLPNSIEVPAGEKIPVVIEAGRDIPEAISCEIELSVPGFSEKARVQGAALGPIFKVTPSRVLFGQVQQNQSASRTVEIENIGGARGNASASIEPPYSLKTSQAGFSIEPGAKGSIQIELKSTETGVKRATLILKTASGDFRVPVEAAVSAGSAAAVGSYVGIKAAPSFEAPQFAPADSGQSAINYGKSLKRVRLTKVGLSFCELSWESLPGAQYQLETRRLSLDSKGDIQVSWEPLADAVIALQQSAAVANVTGLFPGTFYTFRGVARNSSGAVIDRTEETTFGTPGKAPLFTPLRILLLCLACLVGAIARQRRRRA